MSTTTTISHETLDSDSDDSDSGSDYHSFDSDSDSDENIPQTAQARQAERQAREHERERVLQAAGLVIKPVDRQTLTRVRSTKKAKPPPPPPIRHHGSPNGVVPEDLATPTLQKDRELPAIPPVDRDEDLEGPGTAGSTSHVDDAYERYESFKQRDYKRMSIMSTSSTTESIPQLAAPAPAASPKSAYSRLHDFLSKRSTPTPEDRTSKISTSSISGPLPMAATPISREHSPAFGTVSDATESVNTY